MLACQGFSYESELREIVRLVFGLLLSVFGNRNRFDRLGWLRRLPEKVGGVGVEDGFMRMPLPLPNQLQALRADF